MYKCFRSLEDYILPFFCAKLFRVNYSCDDSRLPFYNTLANGFCFYYE